MIIAYAEELRKRLQERERTYTHLLTTTSFEDLKEHRLVKGRREGIVEAISIVSQLFKDFLQERVIDKGVSDIDIQE